MKYRYINLFLLLSLSLSALQSNADNVIGAVIIEDATALDRSTIQNAYIELIGAESNPHNLKLIAENIKNLYKEYDLYTPEVQSRPHPEIPNLIVTKIVEPIFISYTVQAGSSQSQSTARGILNELVGYRVHSKAQLLSLQLAMEKRLRIGVSFDPSFSEVEGRDLHLGVRLSGKTESYVNLSNTGSDRIGKELVAAGLTVSDIAPYFKEWRLRAKRTISSNALSGINTRLLFNVSDNNEIGFSSSLSKAELITNANVPDRKYDRQQHSLYWRYATEPSSVSGYRMQFGLINRDYQRKQETNDKNEKLRMLDFSYRYFYLLDDSSHSWLLSLRKGLDRFGASLTGNSPNTDISFNRYKAHFINRYAFPQQWSLRIDTLAQFSDDHLPYSQRFSIASDSTARAFESGEINGDSGVGVKFEVRRKLSSSFLSNTWVPYSYYGIGKVRNNFKDESTTAAAIGLGVRWYGKKYSGYGEIGKPLIEESAYRESTTRGQFSLTMHF